MSIIVFQHSDIGGPGRLGATLRDHGFRLDVRRPDLHGVGTTGGVPVDLDNVHGLIILGGPQNVTDLAKFPWMQAEVAMIKEAHARELPIIGICLGAQMIAHALGGEVVPRDKPAVGFYPMLINTTGQVEPLLAGIAWDSPQLFTCGQEVKTLPQGATLLASNRNTRHVIFKTGLRTFASIAHFECDRPMVEALMASSKGMLPSAGITESEIKVQIDQLYSNYARLSDRLCVNLATLLFPVARRLSA
ncbi:GMP synthase [glutamine-hydrolyzing] [Phycisphaerales bacterium]|nr:GMP synthase [glutamine-hydrolyzing] [Phycisphaerales bacterium]